jgi:dienelactone hydrolase
MAGMSTRRARVLRLLMVAGALGAAVYWFAAPHIRSAALLLDLTGAAPRIRAWLPVSRHDVSSEDVTVPTRTMSIGARVYRPVRARGPALLIFPGVHGGGVDEPRLVSMARQLAAAGGTVITVPLPDLRAYRLTVRSVDMIEDAIVWASRTFGTDGRIGVAGISFAGGLTLVAAGRPGVSDRLTSVFALGAHADLPRVLRYLCGEGTPATLPPAARLWRSAVFSASRSHTWCPRNRSRRSTTPWLRSSMRPSAEGMNPARAKQLFEGARAEEAALPEPSHTLMRAVNARDVRTLGRALGSFAEEVGGAPELSPARSPATSARVFLLHGTADSVIPSTETLALQAYLTARGNPPVQVLLTPLVTHADARADVPLGDTWRLIRFWTGLWNGLER